MDHVTAYPLCWPEGWKRTDPWRRSGSPFSRKGRERCVTELMEEIRRLGGRNPVLSSMLALRQDGLPYARQPRTDDPGIAVYFTYKNRQMCFACDTYAVDEANIWAIKLTIEALRGIERWGASDMMDRAFTGFEALPAPNWRRTLELEPDATLADAESAYKRLALKHHPDQGGDEERFKEITEAIQLARKAVAP